MIIGSRVKYGELKGWVVAEAIGTKQPIVRWDSGAKTEFLWCLLAQEEE